MFEIKARPGETIHIGRRGENNAVQVVFDITKWITEFGSDGKVEVVVTAPNLETYPAGSISEIVDNKVYWTITDEDTQWPGIGQCELFYLLNGAIVKSLIFDYIVTKSLDYEEGAEPPEYAATWVEKVLAAADNIGETLQTAIDSASAAATSASNASESASAAEGSKNAASESASAADTARLAAETAQGKAEEAQLAAEKAQQAAENAQSAASSSAQAAADSASDSLNSANAAAQSATAASASESNASDSASAAATSAKAAEKSAFDAQNVAEHPPRIGLIEENENPDYWYIWNKNTSQYEQTDYKVRFSVSAVYTNEEEMNSSILNEVGDFVIVSDPLDLNIAKLYVYNGTNWTFVTDLTGYEGNGISTITLVNGNHESGTLDTYRITFTNNKQQPFDYQVYNGADGQSVTHSWDGTNLILTSSSGTTTTNLKGDTGSGFRVFDYYTTVEELQTNVSNPEPGDAYGIGAADPYDIYIYSKSGEWINNGPLQGPQGDKGEDAKILFKTWTAADLNL